MCFDSDLPVYGGDYFDPLQFDIDDPLPGECPFCKERHHGMCRHYL